jgi:MFS superfamily sulfate permease-like transporter
MCTLATLAVLTCLTDVTTGVAVAVCVLLAVLLFRRKECPTDRGAPRRREKRTHAYAEEERSPVVDRPKHPTPPMSAEEMLAGVLMLRNRSPTSKEYDARISSIQNSMQNENLNRPDVYMALVKD